MKRVGGLFGFVVVAALALSACSTPDQNTAGTGPEGGDAVVSACCQVTPTNAIVPNGLGGFSLVPRSNTSGSDAYSGSMAGSAHNGAFPTATLNANATRLIVLMDTDPAAEGTNFEQIVLDTGFTVDPDGAGTLTDTDPDAGGAGLGDLSNNGWSPNPSPASFFRSSTEGAAGDGLLCPVGGGGINGGAVNPALLPAGLVAALGGVGTPELDAAATCGSAANPMRGAKISVGSGARNWSGSVSMDGFPLVVYRFVFLDSAGNLLNSNTSFTERGNDAAGQFLVAVGGGRLSDIVVTSDTVAPAITDAGSVAGFDSGVLTTGGRIQPLPFEDVSWLEINTDMTVPAGRVDTNGAIAGVLQVNERNFRASNVNAGDVITISDGANLGATFVVRDDVNPAAEFDADNSPSAIEVTGFLAYGATNQNYQIFHGSVVSDTREREQGGGAACLYSPSATGTCAIDLGFTGARANAAFVQGQVSDIGSGNSNIGQITVNAAGPGGASNQVAIVSRNQTQATHNYAVVGVNAEMLVVEKTAGSPGGGYDITVANGVAGAAVTLAGTSISVARAALTSGVVGDENLDGDLEDIVNAINEGRPASEAVLSGGGETINYTTNRRGVDNASNTQIEYVSPAPTPNQVLSITVNFVEDPIAGAPDDPDLIEITVNLATDGAGALSSTGDDVANAINADPTAGSYVRAIVTAGGASIVGAMAFEIIDAIAAETSAVANIVRASLVDGTDGSASAGLDLDEGPVLLVNGTNSGRIQSNNPNVTVGLMDTVNGICLPPFLNPPDDGATVGVNESTATANVCFAAQIELTEGVTTFTVSAVDASGNTQPAVGGFDQITRDTAPAFFDTDADAVAGGVSTPPVFCETPEFDNQPVCVTPADVVTSGTSYETFAQQVDIGGKVRDFIPGTTTFDTTTDSSSQRAYVRVVTDNGYDSFTAVDTDALGNPVPYVNGDAPGAADTGEFQYAAIPLRIGGVTNVTVTLWDQAGNVTSLAFSITQITNNTQTPPSLSIDCYTDTNPGLVDCASESAWDNPNTPGNLRLGRFGDPAERGDAPIVAQTTYTNNQLTGIRYLTQSVASQTVTLGTGDGATTVFNVAGAFVAPVGPGTVTVAAGAAFAYDDGVGNLEPGAGVTGAGVSTVNYATGDVSVTFTVAPALGVPVLARANVANSFGPNFLAPLEMRLVSSNKLHLQGRSMDLQGLPPAFLYINGTQPAFFDGALHGTGSGSYPFGLLDIVTDAAVGDNQIEIANQYPLDSPADEIDNQLRVGDYVSLNSFDPAQSANVGLYQITALQAAPCAPCTISLDRPLPQDAGAPAPMFIRSEYIWSTSAILDVPDEGINSYVIAAVDGFNNIRSTVFSVVRDTQPPAIVIQGVVDGAAVFSTTPEVLLSDTSLFLGGVADSTGPGGDCFDGGNTGTGVCVPTVPVSYIRVNRTDGNGEDDTAGASIQFGYQQFGDDVTNTTFYPVVVDPVVIAHDLGNVDGDGDPFSFIGVGPTGADFVNTLDTVSVNPFGPSTVLGTARAARLADPNTIRPLTLDGDDSCTLVSSCPAGEPMSYRVEVQGADKVGLNSNVVVNTDVVEAAVDRLIAGALGIISGNPTAMNLLSDSTDLSTLTLDQLSLSGVLFNSNQGLSTLLGGPGQSPSDNPQTWFYLTGGAADSRQNFGIVLGILLDDPNNNPNTGSPAPAVTLSNVIRILADNGVLDDLLPIIDNVNILNPRVGAGGLNDLQGDFSRMQKFTRNLMVDTTPTVQFTPDCGNTSPSGLPEECYTTEGIIKEAFPAIQAALEFGDIVSKPAAGEALRTKTLGTAAADLDSRLSGDGISISDTGADADAEGDLADEAGAGVISFIPIDAIANGSANDCEESYNDATGQFDSLPADGICRSVVNVQPGDILVLRSGPCSGVARRVRDYADASAGNVDQVTFGPLTSDQFPASCIGGPYAYSILSPNGPSLNPVIELADLLTFGVPQNSYDNQAGGAGPDTRFGEREFLSALLHLSEDALQNRPSVVAAFPDRTLVCPRDNGATGNADCISATSAQFVDDAESLQAVLDLLTELADDQNPVNGTEFITRVIELLNGLLRVEPAGAIPADAAGTSFVEALFPLLTDLLDDGTSRKIGGAAVDRNGLLTVPAVTNADLNALGAPNSRQNSRLNYLLRSTWWLAADQTAFTGIPGTNSISVDLNGNGTTGEAAAGEYDTARPFVAILPLLRALADDPDDNPRGIASNAPPAPVFVPPGFNDAQNSIAEKLLDPVDYVLNDSRLPAVLDQLGDVLDPGTGISDLTAFDYDGPISEAPFNFQLPSNPFSVNPPLLRVISDISAQNIDVGADGPGGPDGEEQSLEAVNRMLNSLLAPIGVEQTPSMLDDNNTPNGPVNTAVCNEGYFAGRTPAEILLNVAAQLLADAEKDPKDFDFGNRTFLDTVRQNRSVLRIILDGLFDDPATNEASIDDLIDEYPVADGQTCAGQNFNDPGDGPGGVCDVAIGGTAASGVRGALGGDGVGVTQSTLDILPELLNTMARFGFDEFEAAEPLTSIFENCTADCPVNDGVEPLAATDRILSNQRLGIDLALQLDAPFQIGSGGGVIAFNQSLVRQALEQIAELDNAAAVNYILTVVSKIEEDIQPMNATTSVPNADDLAHQASAVRALADPDGDGDPTNDGILDDLIPVAKIIPATGQVQQLLDLLRAFRACGYNNSVSPAVDVRGGEILRDQENILLTMLDAYSGATNTLSLDGGTAECPNLGGRGATGGILDSTPFVENETFGGGEPFNVVLPNTPIETFTAVTAATLTVTGVEIATGASAVCQDLNADGTFDVTAQCTAGTINYGTGAIAGLTFGTIAADEIRVTYNYRSPSTQGTLLGGNRGRRGTDATGAPVAGTFRDIGPDISFFDDFGGLAGDGVAVDFDTPPFDTGDPDIPHLQQGDSPAAESIQPGSLAITTVNTLGQTLTCGDDGAGNLTGDCAGSTATLSYVTGQWSNGLISFTSAPALGQPITATYAYMPATGLQGVDFQAAGAGTGAHLCIQDSTSPFGEICALITAQPAAGRGVNVLYSNNNLFAAADGQGDDLDAYIAANCLDGRSKCSYRIRQMREPFNGCRGGIAIANKRLGYPLSSFGGPSAMVPNGFRDARLDLVLRSLNYLADGGNSLVGGPYFPDRLEALLDSLIQDHPQTGDQSMVEALLFGASGVQGNETGPVQALLNDARARKSLTAFLTLFSQLTNSPRDPVTGSFLGNDEQDVRDTYPNFINASDWPAGTTVAGAPLDTNTPCNDDGGAANDTGCNGNAIHDAVDYQFIALKGVLEVLGDDDGLDNHACDVFGRSGSPSNTSCQDGEACDLEPLAGVEPQFNRIQNGLCDDPDALFFTGSLLIQAGLVENLIPGLQIIAEATNALGIGEGVGPNASPPYVPPALLTQRDARLNSILKHRVQINRDTLADMIQRMAAGGNGDVAIFDCLDNGDCADASFTGTWPEDYNVVECPEAGATATACNPAVFADPLNGGILEGAQQIMVRGIYQALLEYVGEDTSAVGGATVDDQRGFGTRRNRMVAALELVSKISGARDSADLLSQALRIVRGIAVDRNADETAATDSRGVVGPDPELAGELLDDPLTGTLGFTQRDVGPILSVQAGLSARGLVDTASPSRSAMDVIGDFLNTLIEDPTDCVEATVGILDRDQEDVTVPIQTFACPARDAAGFGAAYPGVDHPNHSSDVDSVFRDVGVTQERPIQPVFDEPVFDALASIFAGGDEAILTGALPFVGAFFNEQLDYLVNRPNNGSAADNEFAEYDYCEPGAGNPCEVAQLGQADRIADGLLADLQTLIPGNGSTVAGSADQISRFDPLLTDDVNRNGELDPAGTITQGTGTSAPINDLDGDCLAAVFNEVDNSVIDCIQPANIANGLSNDDWGDNGQVCGDRCDAVGSIEFIGYTTADGVTTIAQVDGFDSALIDGLADLIANEDPARAVNNQSNRTTSAREEDTLTQRTVDTVQAVDPA
ncbi:MAG: hypothetical protein AB1405_08630, partial [Bdellovibrionota bacterium]